MSKSSYYRNQNAGEGTWSELFGDVYSGIAVGIGHSKWLVEKTIDRGWDAIVNSLSLLGSSDSVKQQSDNNDNNNDNNDTINGDTNNNNNNNNNNTINVNNNKSHSKGLQVVGVGYGRTGTYSLALALTELGIPTLHTQHLYENDIIFDHFVTNIFHKSIVQNEILMGEPNFDLLSQGGYVATMDLPFALYYDAMMVRYPECKFILTERESSEVWFRSWDVLTRSISKPAQYASFLLVHVRKLEYYMRWLFSVVNQDPRFLSAPFPLPPQNKRRAIASYETHNQNVRATIPPARLLEYNVKQGWEPLCDFLEISPTDCPTHVPFPKSNSARAVCWQSYSAFIGPLVLTLVIVGYVLTMVFRRAVGMSVMEWWRLQKRKTSTLSWMKNGSKKRS